MTSNFGALPGDWHHFADVLGLRDDLLPVVSNPKAVISPDSKIQGPGKTPSDYNKRGQMRGFLEWTDYRATPEDIENWAKEPDYGICLNTRRIRAIDVDVDDFDMANDIEQFIVDTLGYTPPTRRRQNSSKFLMLVDLPGEFTKRRFKTEKGVIEFLATGQQAVIRGTHPSGVRYELDGGLPDSIPAVTPEQFESLWAGLNEKFGTEDSVNTRAGITPAKKRQMSDIDDPLVDYLSEHDWVLDINRDGRVDITCPFESQHTTQSGDSSTSYFPAGLGGFAQGHFRCMHSHCDHRTDNDFKEAIGWTTHGMPNDEEEPAAISSTPVDLDTLFSDLILTDEDVSAMADAEFLIDNLIVRGSLHAFVAPANGGKTTLFIHLCEELSARGLRIFYVNADANPSDLKRHQAHAKAHGYFVLAPDAKAGKGPQDIVSKLRALNETGGDLSELVVILDTLKKFANMIDKSRMRAFLALMRGLSAKGATIILLAHTNKRTEDDGKHIFEGTGDLRNDVDNLIYLEGEKDTAKGIQTVTTRPDKVRATFKPASWIIDLESRQVHQSEGVLHVMGTELRTVLELAKQAIINGAQKQSTLVSFIKDRTALGDKKVRECLFDLTRNYGQPLSMAKGENNASLYSIRDSLAGFDDESAVE